LKKFLPFLTEFEKKHNPLRINNKQTIANKAITDNDWRAWVNCKLIEASARATGTI
jgi:hypothetical protein